MAALGSLFSPPDALTRAVTTPIPAHFSAVRRRRARPAAIPALRAPRRGQRVLTNLAIVHGVDEHADHDAAAGVGATGETPKRLTPTQQVTRSLYLASGNRCAYPG